MEVLPALLHGPYSWPPLLSRDAMYDLIGTLCNVMGCEIETTNISNEKTLKIKGLGSKTEGSFWYKICQLGWPSF